MLRCITPVGATAPDELPGELLTLFCSIWPAACTHRWACAFTCDYTCALHIAGELYWTLDVMRKNGA